MWIALLLLVIAAAILAPRLLTPGFAGPRFAPCPASPNCVSSRSEESARHVTPIAFAGDVETEQERLRRALMGLGRTRIVVDEPGYLRAECRSLVFGFVDDLEVELSAGRIDLRSASRLGHSDLGVNRRRIEALRRALAP